MKTNHLIGARPRFRRRYPCPRSSPPYAIHATTVGAEPRPDFMPRVRGGGRLKSARRRRDARGAWPGRGDSACEICKQPVTFRKRAPCQHRMKTKGIYVTQGMGTVKARSGNTQRDWAHAPRGAGSLARELRTGGLDGDAVRLSKARTIETINTSNNRLDLARCDRLGIYLIRLDRNPKRRPGQGRTEPRFGTVRRGGYRLLPEGGMAWQKPYAADTFNARDEVDARRLVRDAARSLGSQVERDMLL